MVVRKSLKVDSITISYLEQNSSKGNTIFFIHGNSGSSNMWAEQLKDARFNRYRLIAVDLPFHGDSELIPPERNSVIELSSILYQVITKLRFEKLILIGFSLGANLAAEILSHAKDPKGIVLLSPTIIGESAHLGKIAQEGATWGVLFEDEPSIDHLEAFCEDSLSKEFGYKTTILQEYRNVKHKFRLSLYNRQ